VFATLLGALPRPTDAPADIEQLVAHAVQAQVEAGLEPITDGRLRGAGFAQLPSPAVAVEWWRSTASMTDRAVKQALPGPYSTGGGVDGADELARVVNALNQAGCPLVEIEERSLERLTDAEGQQAFREVHARMLEKVHGTHLSLSIVGGAPDPSSWAMLVDLPYASLAVDLIAGPDSWNLVTRLSAERGVIAGAESAREEDESKEVLVWAARYAASTNGRGFDRVGLGSAGSYANLTWESAVRKMRLLGEAARLASLSAGDAMAAGLDPRAVSARAAALGTTARRRRKARAPKR
jgi:methionine synthase II (cobalamin-independent)